MSSMHSRAAWMVWACFIVMGCVDGGDANNDNTAGHLAANKDAGRDASGAASARDAGSTHTTDDGDDTGSSGSDDSDLGEDGGSVDAPPPENGGQDAGNSGSDGPTTGDDVIAGTAESAMCASYAKASGGMCGGYYCGITQDQLAAEIPADTLCPDPQTACEGKLSAAVAKCARDVKSSNPLSSNADNRPKVQTCVFTDATLKATTSAACLGCYLDAAECAGDNCLVDCLAGDSKGCDDCRAAHQCDAPVFSCAKLPTPF